MPVPALRTLHHAAFDAADLATAKRGRRVSVCLPARDEAGTVGEIVRTIHNDLVVAAPLVDEILVVDDHSSDDTAAVARAAGATVVAASAILPQFGDGHGKGEALWKSLFACTGDLIVWCDADVVDFDARFVTGLVGPLLTSDDVGFVKGFYDRPVVAGADGGGRVTELVARPLLALLFPALAATAQPLAGEYAGRRELLEQLPFVQGYGVDLGLLIDVARRFGADAIAQVDLGVRRHRNRPLAELAPQALAVLQAALVRAGLDAGGDGVDFHPTGAGAVRVGFGERPPLVEVPDYRRRSA